MAINDNELGAIKFASISQTSTGDLIAAVTGKKIRVLGYTISSSANVTLQFTSSSTAISGVMDLGTRGNIYGGGSADAPALQTAVGEKLALTQTGAGTVSGHLSYVLIDE